jgi:hypothetical protein
VRLRKAILIDGQEWSKAIAHGDSFTPSQPKQSDKNKKPWPEGHGFLKSISARFLSRDGGRGMTG